MTCCSLRRLRRRRALGIGMRSCELRRVGLHHSVVSGHRTVAYRSADDLGNVSTYPVFVLVMLVPRFVMMLEPMFEPMHVLTKLLFVVMHLPTILLTMTVKRIFRSKNIVKEIPTRHVLLAPIIECRRKRTRSNRAAGRRETFLIPTVPIHSGRATLLNRVCAVKIWWNIPTALSGVIPARQRDRRRRRKRKRGRAMATILIPIRAYWASTWRRQMRRWPTVSGVITRRKHRSRRSARELIEVECIRVTVVKLDDERAHARRIISRSATYKLARSERRELRLRISLGRGLRIPEDGCALLPNSVLKLAWISAGASAYEFVRMMM